MSITQLYAVTLTSRVIPLPLLQPPPLPAFAIARQEKVVIFASLPFPSDFNTGAPRVAAANKKHDFLGKRQVFFTC